jgi:hypothetical protein
VVGLVAASAGAVLLALFALGASAQSPPKSVTVVDRTWTCRGPVDLDSVTVTMTPAAVGVRANEDAIHLQPGCTGRIGRIDVTQSAGDGVKVADGVHDLEIDGGRIRCLAKAPGLHQDGVQVLGGTRVTLRDLDIECGRADDRLINSNFFVREAGASQSPPTDVVCTGCTLGGWAAHTVSVQSSIRSGVIDSTLCLARFPQLTLTVGPDAIDPVTANNTIRQCGPGQLTIAAGARTAAFGQTVSMSGLFLAQTLGSPVTLEGRAFDATAFTSRATVLTNQRSRWEIPVRPGAATVYRARLGDVISPSVLVRVRPLVVLTRRSASRFRASVGAGRSFAGRTVTLQQLQDGRWVDVRPLVLGAASTRSFTYRVQGHGVSLRLVSAAAPGFLAAASDPLVVP